MSKAHFSSTMFPFAEQAAARERARIRRLIGPALRVIRARARGDWFAAVNVPLWKIVEIIDAATKPEPKRKVKK